MFSPIKQEVWPLIGNSPKNSIFYLGFEKRLPEIHQPNNGRQSLLPELPF